MASFKRRVPQPRCRYVVGLLPSPARPPVSRPRTCGQWSWQARRGSTAVPLQSAMPVTKASSRPSASSVACVDPPDRCATAVAANRPDLVHHYLRVLMQSGCRAGGQRQAIQRCIPVRGGEQADQDALGPGEEIG